MDLRELGHDEQLALVALVELVVEANARVTAEESHEVSHVAEALGRKRYRRLTEEADDRFRDEAAFREFLATITRQDARELIYGTVLRAASADTMSNPESALLEWLAKAWQITVRFEIPSGGGKGS